jgi:hypothetical protein
MAGLPPLTLIGGDAGAVCEAGACAVPQATDVSGDAPAREDSAPESP